MFKKKILIAGLIVLTACGGVALVINNDTKDNLTQQVGIENKDSNDIVEEETQIEDKKEDVIIDDSLDKDVDNVGDDNKEVVDVDKVEDEVINSANNEQNVNEEKPVVKRTDLNNFLFVGDSFTVRIKRHITANNTNAYVHAKSSTMPSYWLDKVSEMPNNDKVDGICLLIGVNGASRHSNLVDAKELINRLIEKYPDKKIYVQKVFPVGSEFKNANPDKFNNSIKKYNNGIEEFCKTKENLYFIDTTSGYVDNNGYLIKHNGDGLHIDESYDKGFYQNIENQILSLINN